MSLFDSKRLSFDLEDLKKLQKNTQELLKDLTEQRDDLMKGLDILRNNWQTPTGKDFFKNLDGQWEGQVRRFASVLKVFDRMLEQVVRDYSSVQQTAERIAIRDF